MHLLNRRISEASDTSNRFESSNTSIFDVMAFITELSIHFTFLLRLSRSINVLKFLHWSKIQIAQYLSFSKVKVSSMNELCRAHVFAYIVRLRFFWYQSETYWVIKVFESKSIDRTSDVFTGFDSRHSKRFPTERDDNGWRWMTSGILKSFRFPQGSSDREQQ